MKISGLLKEWYEMNKRDLPWRRSSNPYKIWVSEIILQQTRVIQGYHYYNRFLEHFPDVFSLANAPLDHVLKIWEGLGYYSRARNMHTAAKQVVQDYQGRFPKTFHELKKLKGIGDYTAAAVASIAFNEPVALVDGNVYRVLARLHGIYTPINTNEGKKQFFQLATEHMDHQQPGVFNQALMEFGAIHCVPRNPGCPSCIFQHRCYAHKNSCVQELPVKLKAKKPRSRYFYYFLVKKDEEVFIHQRKEKDIWQELFQFPLKEEDKQREAAEVTEAFTHHWNLNDYTVKLISPEYKHQLTHQLIIARLIMIEVKHIPPLFADHFIGTNIGSIRKYAFPRLLNTLIDNHMHLKQ